MGKRFDTMLFPNGLAKAFTLSYDDGVRQDERLITMFDRYGAKCTFNLNYGVLGYRNEPVEGRKFVDISKFEPGEVKDMYRNHEIGGHGLYHSSLTDIGTPLAMHEIIEDKRQLEALIGKPLKMFAYPFGFFDEDVKDLLGKAGYFGARTVESTHQFRIPKDFLQWDPTCHHKDPELMNLLEKFVKAPAMGPSLFYLWGHGYEFDFDDNWDVIENAVRYVAENGKDVWFATNGEIIDCVLAYNRLQYSADGSLIHNPSAQDVWIQPCFGRKICLKAGETTVIEDTPL